MNTVKSVTFIPIFVGNVGCTYFPGMIPYITIPLGVIGHCSVNLNG